MGRLRCSVMRLVSDENDRSSAETVPGRREALLDLINAVPLVEFSRLSSAVDTQVHPEMSVYLGSLFGLITIVAEYLKLFNVFVLMCLCGTEGLLPMLLQMGN